MNRLRIRQNFPAILASASCVLAAAVLACGPPAAPPSAAAPAVQTPPPSASAAPAPTSAPPSPKPALGDLARQIIPELAEQISRHDAKKLAELYADDATVEGWSATPAHGRDEIARSAQRMFDAISTLKLRVARAWIGKDAVVAEWVMTGTHSGELFGVRPSEKPLGLRGVTVYVLRDDGLVSSERVYADSATLLSQMGAIKTKVRLPPVLPTTTEWHLAKGTADEDKNADLGRKLATDWDAARLSDDVVYDDMAEPISSGKDDLKKSMKAFAAAVPDAKVTVGRAWGVEDFTIFESAALGTLKGPLRGAPATNAAMTLHRIDVARVLSGKIARGWTYSDSAELGVRAGASAARPTKH